jgi:hypothetical protein
LEWKRLVCSMTILNGHLVHFMSCGNLVAIWYISPHFGILCKEKSANPGWRGLRGVF